MRLAMKLRRSLIQDAIAVTFIFAGLTWVIALRFSVHAQQPSTPQVTALNKASADTPKFENAKLQARELSGSLNDTVNRWAAAATNAEWLGYAVAEVAGERSVCCSHGGRGNYGDDDCGTCRLENSNHGTSISNSDKLKAKLEAPREIAVLYRAESGKIGQIRVFSQECTVDAGGLPIIWLEAVKPAESVGLLERLTRGASSNSTRSENFSESALTALALHADSSADRALESLAAPSEPVSLRKHAVFWLGEARGAEGLRILQKMAQSDPSPEVREQVSFALSMSKEPGALPELIRMAHDDTSSEVRGQALFWLGQKAGEKAARAITGSIDNDPDTEVKKKAVFALSQMPPEQGVPKLIQVAQGNHNPQVRKEAMFWLGQSNDPQALAFFEKVLSQ
jgi:hypothetical protein